MSKKLLFFSYDFPPLDGGISRLCDEIVKSFVKHKWEVDALSTQIAFQKGANKVQYPVNRVSRKRFIREIESYKILKNYPKDTLIITGVWHPEALLAMLAGHENVVVLAHGNDIMKGANTVKNKVLSLLRKWTLGKAKLVICNSHYTQDTIKQQFPDIKTTVCTLGVDEKRFTPVNDKIELRKNLNLEIDKKIILTVSRINRYKAHDTVLKALSLLDKEHRAKLQYCIAGRGDYLESLQALAKELDIEDCIYWFGFVDEDQLADLYRASDLFVLCTREEQDSKSVEGFGLVFLEAQACGIPVIGSNQGGIPDAVKHNNGGWIIQRDDSVTLADYFKKLADNDIIFKEEGKKARQRVEQEATWSHFSEKVFDDIAKIEGVQR